MVLDPRARDFLELIETLNPVPVNHLSVTEARARKIPLTGQNAPIAEQRDVVFSGRNGDIPARLYIPRKSDLLTTTDETAAAISLPQIVFIHGGGWVLGELPHYDQLCTHITALTGCLTVSIDYRLAPEAPFPHGLHDCLDAVTTLAQHPLCSSPESTYPWYSDPRRMFLMGDSAGGNLATVVALQLGQELLEQLRGQILLYPVTDARLTRPSYRSNGEGYLLTTDMMAWFWDHYCPRPELRMQSTAAPLLAGRFDFLPPSYILTCQYDPLKDEGNAYAKKLAGAGIPVMHREVPGMIHGFMRMLHTFPQAQEQLSDIAAWIKTCLLNEPLPSHVQ